MPQLDLFSLGNQFFWGVIFFVIFYFFTAYYVIPSVFSIMFARSFYTSKVSDDSVKLISLCFVFSSVASLYHSDFSSVIRSILDNVYANKFVYNVALSEFVSLELSDIYDNVYFNDDEK
jgi:hypothetical protein